MRIFQLTIFFVLILITSRNFAQQSEDWVYFASSMLNNDTSKHFYDANSIEHFDSYISIRAKETTTPLEFDEKSKKYIKERIIVVHIYCKEKMSNPILIFKYFTDGTSITYNYTDYLPEKVIPGTVDEDLLNLICGFQRDE